ncbi:E3 ubiquitin-protein ligase TRIM39-like [Scomber scombrus]|uniref:E3 ubiquitin-protein ligase TRIM39-like n=1 Tax=Scomber scombrus TaxID=13677 RepID=UPI002DD97961|nr:E3 ubiquitin-protein ligase TRIM39-like [Scomber scombrus]
MASATSLLSEDQFLCSICLDVFTDPVSTPCGHSFCKNCINEHWDIIEQCQCPTCKKFYYTRPELEVNIFISEMVSQFRQELGETEAEIQQMIQKRNLKIQEIKHSVELSKENTDKEIAEDVEAFTKLKESVERCQARVIKMIEEKQKLTEKQAEGFIKELEKEISELKKRNSELEKLSHSEDHFNVLQSFQSLIAVPPTKDWTEVRVQPLSYDGKVKTALAEMVEKLKNMFIKDELMWAQKYAVDVTMDPDTAHPKLILSDDGKQVHHVDAKKNLPDNPERFTVGLCVLGKQSVSSGRFYFEVQVKEKPEWFFGVARESINRKGLNTVSFKESYWTLGLKNEKYFILSDTPAVFSLKSKPERVGAFVDYEEGLVSFYDVDAAALIYSFTRCSFNEKLLPFFCPCFNQDGKNSTPLIISTVHYTE